MLKVGERSITYARKVLSTADAPLIAAVDQGKLPVSVAAVLADRDQVERTAILELIEQGVQPAGAIREVRREQVRVRLDELATTAVDALIGVYDVIVIDPPWPTQKIERDERPNQTQLDYPTMSEDELRQLVVPCATDCHVWLWTTQRFLPMALHLLGIWNLRYVCTFVWHKDGGFQPFGLPQFNCEFVLYARRGSPMFLDTTAFDTCFAAPRGKHSEKPAEFYETVRRVTAGRRLDMFARRKIDGFVGWGQEVSIEVPIHE